MENADAAGPFMERMGICTVYPASPEVPNLFHAYLSDPEAKTDSSWDSPSGEVYTWRWRLGATDAAFYGLIGKRPTWVAWDLLPSVLAVFMERRSISELYSEGLLSQESMRIGEAFQGAGGILSTKELRMRAGFPKGKENRASYEKALEELERKLIVAKKLGGSEKDDVMFHALVADRHADAVAKACQISLVEGISNILDRYLRAAQYLAPKAFNKFFKFPQEAFEEAISRGGFTTAELDGEEVLVRTGGKE